MRKLTRRSYNRKLIVFGLAIFLAFGMISTGFAAWLISSAAEKDIERPVEVDTIVDKSFELEINELDDSGNWIGKNISFDARKEDTNSTDRVQFHPNGESDGGEQLELLLSGTVTNRASLGKQNESAPAGAVKVDITLPASIVAAINADYLTASYTVGTDTTNIDVEGKTGDQTITVWIVPTANAEDATKGDFAVTLKFGWGTEFGGMNPGDYYDTEGAGKAVTDTDMKAELEAFRLTLVGPLADGEDALTKVYDGKINFTVTAAASY